MAANSMADFEVGGSLVLLLAALGCYVAAAAYGRLKKVEEAYDRSLQFARWKEQSIAAESEAAANASRPAPVNFSVYARRAAPLMLLIVLLLPYPYEPGGNLVIYPMQKVEVSPDVAGIVSEIYFDGGEWVKKGTPIARMKDDDNLSKLQQLSASVKAQEAVVDNLKTLPKPEAVALAQADVKIAQTHEQFSGEKEPRILKLYKQGGVSLDEYNTAKKQHDDDVDQVAQKIAQLKLVQAGPTADEIKAAEAELDALKAERDDFQDKVNRAVLNMPFDGQIMTMHLKDKTNMYLERGKFFAAVEDSSSMTVEIDVPERDIGFVKVGQKVRARPQAYNTEDFSGTVTAIDPNVTPLASGNIVKVLAVIENKDGKLKSGMSGYAKTSGQTMPVWRAFSLALLDFFNVDIWSWIP
jgi:putative peptide zinc metalloprotease protein